MQKLYNFKKLYNTDFIGLLIIKKDGLHKLFQEFINIWTIIVPIHINFGKHFVSKIVSLT